MNHPEKCMLVEYLKRYRPVWQITQIKGHARTGLYQIRPYLSEVALKEDAVPVERFDGERWIYDGKASWGFVKHIKDRYKEGKRMDDLAEGLTREENVIWKTV